MWCWLESTAGIELVCSVPFYLVRRHKPSLLAAGAGLWRNICVPVSDNSVAKLFGQICLLLSWKVPPGQGAAASCPLELGVVYCQLNLKALVDLN